MITKDPVMIVIDRRRTDYAPAIGNDPNPFLVFQETEILSAVIKERLTNSRAGLESLVFSLPLDNEYIYLISNEDIVIINGERRFRIKRMIKDNASRTVTFECDALWYDIGNSITYTMLDTGGNRWTLTRILYEYFNQMTATWDEPWTFYVDNSIVYEEQTVVTPVFNEGVTAGRWVRYLAKLFNAEILYDTFNNIVRFYKEINAIQDYTVTPTVLTYSKNLQAIRKYEDTTRLITGLTMFGKNNITIAPINGGDETLTDYNWFYDNNRQVVKSYEYLTDERFTDLYSMQAYMRTVLDVYARPIVTYEIDGVVLDNILEVGETVFIIDKELDVISNYRIFEREIDLLDKRNNKYTAENTLLDLSSEDEFSDILDN